VRSRIQTEISRHLEAVKIPLTMYRAEKAKYIRLDLRDFDTPIPEPESSIFQADIIRLFSRNLTPKHKTAIVEYYINGKNQIEIADAWGCTKSAVSQLLLTAIRKLKNKKQLILRELGEN
jgi:RNA polymerase sigma factor (sigma-70 family)